MRSSRTLGGVVAVLLLLAGCGEQAEPDQTTSGDDAPKQEAPAADETPRPDAEADSPPDSEPPPASKQVPVPDELRFTTETVDGKAFTGRSLAGKPTVLWFWAPWCPVCQREAPTVAKAAKDSDATFVGVASKDDASAMRNFVGEHELGGFEHLADTDSSVWAKFGVTYQPAYAFVGADGTVDVHPGSLSESELTAKIDALTGG